MMKRQYTWWMPHNRLRHCRSFQTIGFAATIVMTMLQSSIAHVVWTYPPPRLSSSIKEYPCGSDDAAWGSGSATTLTVGLNTVVFDEYICHAGDMVRIAMSMHNDYGYDDYVLLDRLPHNDQWCTGASSSNLHAVNITLPDVDCNNNECSLQIIQVMTSKFRERSCANPGGIAAQCGDRGFMYYSCARIRIMGQASILPEMEHYNDYYGAKVPVDYLWPLMEDWCRDSSSAPWQICNQSQLPQAKYVGQHSSFTDAPTINDDTAPPMSGRPVTAERLPSTTVPVLTTPVSESKMPTETSQSPSSFPTMVPTLAPSVPGVTESPSLSSDTGQSSVASVAISTSRATMYNSRLPQLVFVGLGFLYYYW